MSADEHTPGTLCWIELGTTDVDAAKTFYGKLCGWETKSKPMAGANEGSYTTIINADKPLGGMHAIEASDGAPAYWGSYIAVTDVDATTTKAQALGASVITEPFDIPDIGRMAVLKDPTGATISLWLNSSAHKGADQLGVPRGHVCWIELVTDDVEAATTFYCELFGWTSTVQQMGDMGYTIFNLGDQPVAGMMKKPAPMGDAPAAWMIYITVAECDAALKAAESGGGKTVFPPKEIKDIGRFAWIADPQGAMLAILEPPTT